MRVLFVTNFYPPYDIGGYEKHCQEVTEALRYRGHDVQVLTSRYAIDRPIRDSHVRRMLFLETDLQHYSPSSFFLRRKHQERYNANTIREVIANADPDVILFWGMWNLSRHVPAVAETSDLPVAYWLEDLWPIDTDLHTRYWCTTGQGFFGRLLMPLASKLALRSLTREGFPPPLQFQYVACGSQFLKRKLAAHLPTFQKAEVILCGIELDAFAGYQPHKQLFELNAPRIIYVGGLGPQKGVHTAVEAVAHLTSQYPALQPTLTVVGNGHPDYLARLRQLAANTGIAGQLHFTGAVTKDCVPSLLAEHDILVVPSAWEEPFGRVVVEGMAAGLVVVGTATGGSAEILADEINGLVFPVENAEALAGCIRRLIDDPALYARLAYAGKQSSEQFDLKRMVDGIERFLIEIGSASEHGADD